MRRALAFLFVPAIPIVVFACTGDPVVLATIPAFDAGPGAKSVRCLANADCAGGFCEKSDCHDPGGTCRPYPEVCDEDEEPVCGCDGVTYYNDCLRRAGGIASATHGECEQTAMPCGPSAACPAGASCARLMGFGPGDQCDDQAPGRCWVLPAACPAVGGSDRWDPCVASPDGVDGGLCVDTCDAIRSGLPHHRELQCH